MKILAAYGQYICASCHCPLWHLRLPDQETGEFEVRCAMRWCQQYGETATMTALLIRAESRNTIATWPADAP